MMQRPGWLASVCRLIRCRRDRFLRIAGFAKTIDLDSGSRKSESGQAIVEIAIALPIIAAFTFAMIELCLAFYSYCMISECAREGTRYAIVRGSTCQTGMGASCTASKLGVESAVSHLGWPNLGGGTMTPVATYLNTDENPGSPVQVVVTYDLPYNIPFAPKGMLHLTSTSVMYILQ